MCKSTGVTALLSQHSAVAIFYPIQQGVFHIRPTVLLGLAVKKIEKQLKNSILGRK